MDPFPRLKVALVGEPSVGKSKLLLRVIDGSFSHSYVSTIGFDCRPVKVPYRDTEIDAWLWDTAGSEAYNSYMPAHLRGADGVLIVYSIVNANSLESLPKWINLVRTNAPRNVKCMIVGAQSDREGERVVLTERGKDFAEEQGMDFMETSAATGANVQTMICTIVKLIMEERERQATPTSLPLDIMETVRESSSSCC
jgi:small GTP-binding protein